MMFVTKKAIPRRTVLRGIGATLALPLLDGMVPALTALGRSAAKPALRFGAVYVPNGMVMQNWTPADRGNRLRAHTDPAAAGAVSRPADRAVGARDAAGNGPRAARTRLDLVPDGRDAGQAGGLEPEGGPLAGSAAGGRAAPAHPPGITRNRPGGRQLRRLVQRRPQLLVLVHGLVAQRVDPAAHGAQSAGGLRTVVRRHREHGSGGAPGPHARAAQHSRRRERGRGAAVAASRSERPRQGRRVPRRGPRRRAAHRAGGAAGRRGRADGDAAARRPGELRRARGS